MKFQMGLVLLLLVAPFLSACGAEQTPTSEGPGEPTQGSSSPGTEASAPTKEALVGVLSALRIPGPPMNSCSTLAGWSYALLCRRVAYRKRSRRACSPGSTPASP